MEDIEVIEYLIDLAYDYGFYDDIPILMEEKERIKKNANYKSNLSK